MKWPWKAQKQEEPMRSPTVTAVAADKAPSEDLQRGRAALQAAEHAYRRAAARRPAVEAAGQDLARTISRNHLAELVRDALGSGS